MNKYLKFSGSVIVASLLVGCGGGGGSSTPPNLDTTVTGKAVDGYLRYSTVCLDLSKDGYCQTNEPMTLTDENGGFTLTVSSDHKAHANYRTAQLLVYGGQDSDTGTDFIGKLKAPNDGETINVTPLTTLVAEIVADTTTTTTVAEAKEKVAKVFGLTDASKVSADPVALAKTDSSVLNAALQIQKAVESIVENSSTSGTTAKQDLSKDLFKTLAAEFKTVNTTTSTANFAEIMETKKADILTVAAIDNTKFDNAKNVAVVVKEVIVGNITDTSVLATKVEYVKANPTKTSTEVNGVSDETLKIEGVKKLFAGLGITWNDSYNTLATQGTIKPSMTLADIKKATTNATIIAAVDAKIAANEFAKNSTALTKASLDAMFAESNIKADADVDSAKLMIKNIRELGTSLYDGDAKTGLVVDQEALITAEVEKIVANSKNKIKATEQNVKSLIESMGTEVEVLDEVAQALATELEGKVDEEKTSDTITVKGTGYSFSVNYSVSNEDDAKFTINGTSDVLIEKDGTKFTGKLVINMVNDERLPMFSSSNNFKATFDGVLTTKEGRSFNGKISLDPASGTNFLEGKLAGKATEPTLEGKIALNAKLLDLQKMNDDSSLEWSWNNIVPIVYDSSIAGYKLNTTQVNTKFDLENYVFPVQINGAKYYITDVWYNTGCESYWCTNGMGMYIDGYGEVNVQNGVVKDFSWETNTLGADITSKFVALKPEPKVSFDNIAKSIAFSGSVKDTNVEASFDIFINSLGDDNLDQVLIKNLNYKDDKLVIAADTFEMKNTIASGVETDTISLKSLTVNGGTINLSLSGNGSSAMKDDKELSSSLNAKFVFANGAASLDGELKSSATYNTCGDESAYDVSFVGKLTANDFVPFKILVGSTGGIVGTAVSENSYLLLDRNGYKLALTDTASETYNATSCQMTNKTHSISGVDSNGVKVNSTDAKAFTMKNKAGTALGTVTNGIVTYSNNTGESVF